MTKIKSLAYETAIYGVPSIIGRFLNYLLVPLYTNILPPEEYGISANIFGWIALVLMLLTFGMETGFFRYASEKGKEKEVFGSALSLVSFNATLLVAIVFLFQNQIGGFLGYTENYELLIYATIIVSLDALTAIPFAKLRLDKKPIVFASIRMINLVINIGANLVFFLLLPYLIDKHGMTFSFYDENNLLPYIFISNLIASACTIILLIFLGGPYNLGFNKNVLVGLIKYSTPILIVSLAGVINMYGDRILFPFLLEDTEEAKRQLGIYSANCKIGMLMVLFTQAFRYAYEPFIFSNRKNIDSKEKFGEIMTHFVWFGMLIVLFVLLFLPYIQYFIGSDYREGLHIVPIILFANLFAGIFFNLSVWYKLTDKTRYGAYFALSGSAIILIINISLVPTLGYIASAWATLLGNVVMVSASFFFMKKYYPLKYNYLRILEYIVIALILWFINLSCQSLSVYLLNGIRVLLMLFYIGYYIKRQQLTHLLKLS